MRGNGAYDPDWNLGGDAPQWWPLYQAMYANYVCLGSKITCMWHTYNTHADHPPIRLFVAASRTTSFETNTVADVYDEPYHKMIVVNNATPARYWKITMYAPTRKMFRTFSMGDNNFICNTNQTPAFQFYWLAGATTQGQDPAEADIILTLDIKIKYYVKFSDPQQNNQYERSLADPQDLLKTVTTTQSVVLTPSSSSVVVPVLNENKV